MTLCIIVPEIGEIMSLEKLTERQREIYTQVEDYRKLHPDSSNMHILKELNLNPSTYAAARKILRDAGEEVATPKRKYTKRKTEMFTLPVEESTAPTVVIAFVGDSASVVKSVNEYMKGK